FLVQQREIAGFRVDGKCVDRSALLVADLVDFADGVEEALVRMNREERRIGHFAGQHGRRYLAGGQIQLGTIDTLAILAGVGADVDPELVRLGVLIGGSNRGHRYHGACQESQEEQHETESRHFNLHNCMGEIRMMLNYFGTSCNHFAARPAWSSFFISATASLLFGSLARFLYSFGSLSWS